uniref:Transmembrane protein n=1 Tax=Cannabis sativa TaxID=3483 RepID=A0A803NX13_CANSA
MQRSSSTSRASDEFLVNFPPPSFVPLPMKSAAAEELPLYKSNSDANKKELGVHKSSGENIIHVIPLILILCGFILWVFSHPGKV